MLYERFQKSIQFSYAKDCILLYITHKDLELDDVNLLLISKLINDGIQVFGISCFPNFILTNNAVLTNAFSRCWHFFSSADPTICMFKAQ